MPRHLTDLIPFRSFGRPLQAMVGIGMTVALACCTAVGTIPGGASLDSQSLDPAVLTIGYDRIGTIYLRERSLGEVTAEALGGLSTLDNRVRADNTIESIDLYADDRLIGRFQAPRGADARAWANLTMDAVYRARTVSPTLQSASADAVYTAMFNAVTGGLDPYSRYLDPERASRERSFREGYGGIGLLLEYDDAGTAIIQQVFPGGPADDADVLAGDIILAVDGMPVGDWELSELGMRLRGPIDSTVSVTLLSTDGGVRIVDLVRAQVIPNTVEVTYRGPIAVIRINRFNASTSRDLRHAVDEVEATLGGMPDGIVLDLRGNPGGLLGESVRVADLFIDGGEVIHTRGRHPDSFQYFDADQRDIARGVPMVVLIDGRSASGSEIVAAALQDAGRAVVVGASSFGKGSVQTVTRLPNGGELFLTWSRIFAPSGYTLHQQGVLPTICTSTGLDSVDEVVDRFRSGRMPVPAGLGRLRIEAADDPAALDALRDACPWRAHDEQLDEDVAVALLLDRLLFDRALSASLAPTLAQR